MPLPEVNPIDEEWFERRVPIDHSGTSEIECPNCGPATGESYRAILNGHGGIGAPLFVRPFLKRKSTAGKFGRRSNWVMCTSCRALLPTDEAAEQITAELGQPSGFGVRFK